MAKIGIRLADGRFFPILDEGDTARKRLVLTTVKDDQPSVQIDVYRAEDDDGSGRDYVGSLVIENIPPRPRGEPDVRLELGLDGEGNLSAYAREEASGEHQTLSVSLKALSEEEKYEIPDFDFQEDEAISLSTDEFPEMNPFDGADTELAEEAEEAPAGTQARESLAVKAAAYAGKDFAEDAAQDAEEEAPAERRKPSLIISILLALAALGLVLAISFLVFKCVNEREVDPPAPAVSQAPAPAPAPVQPPAPAPVPLPAPAPAPVAETAPVAPPAEATAAKPAKEPGVWYKIRWGDTLWDLAQAYYRNPWLYGKISRYNKIKNPDLIISATWIYIPKP